MAVAKAETQNEGEVINWTADATYTKGDIVQVKDGRAGIVLADVTSGNDVGVEVTIGAVYKIAKTASVVYLKGGRAYYDVSATKTHFKKVNDVDFYLGRFSKDAASSDTYSYVALNVDPPYDIDMNRDAMLTTVVGTQAIGGLADPRVLGGSRAIKITATSEAQKVDILSVDGFAVGANAIVEFALRFPNGGSASASDFNVGVASGTHASDADSISQYIFLHVDGGSANINFQSKDGTTTVASTDSTLDFTAGTALANRNEVWMDMRDPTDVQIYVDGVLVLGSTVFAASAFAGPWFLLAHAEKSTGTETGDMTVDWLKARFSTI
jgi:predicted RecA/RadA family phage recombinase